MFQVLLQLLGGVKLPGREPLTPGPCHKGRFIIQEENFLRRATAPAAMRAW